MVYNLTYRRPAYVPPKSSASSMTCSDSDDEKPVSSVYTDSSTSFAGIPEALSFDKIISEGTCPPCTARDFMNYLLYIEHSAENLQFFLWHRDYVQRFKAASKSDTALSPEWTQAQQETAMQDTQAQVSAKKAAKGPGEDMFKGTEFVNEPKITAVEATDPFETPPQTAAGAMSQLGSNGPWGSQVTMGTTTTGSIYPTGGSNVDSYRSAAATASEAFLAAGLKKPFTIQPFREEVDRVIANYIVKGAPRELNLSSRERNALLRALEYTTHPSAFNFVAKTVEWSLRHQSHPNFIRWTICNGNKARQIFARGLGISTILLGIVYGILTTLSSMGRGWRALSAIFFFIGISTFFAAWKGMCVVLHGMHHRHLRPWELFVVQDTEYNMKNSFDSLGSANSYEDEPWIVKYDNRNIIRKIFDREVWVQEPALRQIQDTIFIQSLIVALLASAALAGIFVALPNGHMY